MRPLQEQLGHVDHVATLKTKALDVRIKNAIISLFTLFYKNIFFVFYFYTIFHLLLFD